MLISFGRWLRAAGYDTKIVTTALPDFEILKAGIAEKRIVLTRDRHFLAMKGHEEFVCYLASNSLQECAAELKAKLSVDWLYAPFSRCLVCNTLFIESSQPELLRQVPEKSRKACDKVWYCPECHKVFWQASHTKRMLLNLHYWQQSV